MAALSAKLTVPLDAASLIGAKVSVMGQTPPGATEPQLCEAVTVETEEVRELKLSAALPQFVTLSVAVDVLSAATEPRATDHVVGHTEGAGVLILSFETKL
jgi:hypothetical protein